MSTSFRPGTIRWLSSHGHPGYGAKYAKNVWEAITAYYGKEEFLSATTQEQSSMVWYGIGVANLAVYGRLGQ